MRDSQLTPPDDEPGHDSRQSSGETTSRRDEAEPSPRLPHERDESASEQASNEASHRPLGETALKDERSEREPTDRSAETDQTYNRNFVRDDAAPPRP